MKPLLPAKPPTTKKDVNKLYRVKYGLRWNPMCGSNGQPVAQRPDVFIEQEVLRFYDVLKKHQGQLLMPWKDHFQKFCELIWANKDCTYPFVWNPLAKRMLEKMVEHRFLGISGHASSGKSQMGAVWAIANFLIAPDETRVLVTSTSLQESRLRIWGVIERYWVEAEKYFTQVAASLNSPPSMPGKLVTSSGKITGFLNGRVNDLVGIALIAGGKGNDGDASTKIGFKSQGKLILVADELPMLTHRLYEATANLLSVDKFQMIATGNFASAFDPFGIFVEPEEGWGSITEDMYEWRTRIGGYCIRFDGEQSPNVLARKEIYPGLLTEKGLQEIRDRNGEKSPAFYRMIKSFPCPTGQENMIYSEPELIGNFADHCGNTPWLRRPTPIAFLDPSFSTGGDAAAASFGLLGDAQVAGKTVTILEKVATIDLMMKVNARSKDYDRNEQLADLFNAECNTRGVAIEDRGLDATGGGDPFATLLAMKMGKGFQLVNFGGAASDKAISVVDTRPGKDRFVNKVSELWYVGKEFVLSGQIRGLDPETILELINRTYKSIGRRIQVEPKDKMKERTSGRSPDRADSWVGLLEVARRRYKFMAAARAAIRPVKVETPDDWFAPPKEEKGKKFRDFFSSDVGFHNEGNFAWGEDIH
jgi:hypothetical protein